MPDFVIGRQQIFDRNLEVFGYELLYRVVVSDPAEALSGTQASNQVVVDTLLEHGLDRVVGQHRAFINFTRRNLLIGTPALLPRDRVVVEVLESVAIDEGVIRAVERLSQKGYMIALDDFVYSDQWQPLVELADIVKLDIQQPGEAAGVKQLQLLQQYPVKILAEKVESMEQYRRYHDLGCDYFQGYLFHEPHILSGRRLASHQPAVMRLLAAINKPKVDVDELAQAIAMDVGLSYKLLRYINAAQLYGCRRVESIPDAIASLGSREMRRWANLIALSTVEDAPGELLSIGLVRAKMCELLALASGGRAPEQYFLVGMLSTVDQMLTAPIDEILGGLPLAEDIRRALLRGEGDAGRALNCAINYERWNLDQVAYHDLNLAQIGEIYLASVAWVNSVDASLAVHAPLLAQD